MSWHVLGKPAAMAEFPFTTTYDVVVPFWGKSAAMEGLSPAAGPRVIRGASASVHSWIINNADYSSSACIRWPPPASCGSHGPSVLVYRNSDNCRRRHHNRRLLIEVGFCTCSFPEARASVTTLARVVAIDGGDAAIAEETSTSLVLLFLACGSLFSEQKAVAALVGSVQPVPFLHRFQTPSELD